MSEQTFQLKLDTDLSMATILCPSRQTVATNRDLLQWAQSDLLGTNFGQWPQIAS